MILKISNKQYTNSSLKSNKKTTFIYSSTNEKYIKEAKKNGCKSFLSSKELISLVDFSNIRIVGITGTNGKTTTAFCIYHLLLSLGFKVALQGTQGFFINGIQKEDYTLTTPDQLTNFSHIIKAQEEKCQFFIMEVSSHAIVQNRIEGLEFSLKILTNISRDHLDYHKNLDDYICVKNSFFDDDSLKLINKDDKNSKYNPKNSLTYSISSKSDFQISSYDITKGLFGKFIYENQEYSFNTHLRGVFNIYNILASISSVYKLTSKPLSSICKHINSFQGVSGRVEIISQKPFIVIDFAHTPDGMEEVFKSFISYDIIVVFGAGGNRDKDKRTLMGQIAYKYAKDIIITSDNPRYENEQDIIKDIIKDIPNRQKIYIQPNRKEAIKNGISLIQSNSVVLILGKGDEKYQIIKDEKIDFSDKEVVKTILKSSILK